MRFDDKLHSIIQVNMVNIAYEIQVNRWISIRSLVVHENKGWNVFFQTMENKQN